MRPAAWGFIVSIVGCFFWIIFSVMGGLGEWATGQADPQTLALVYLFGIMFFFGLPVAILVEIAQWARRRKKKAGAMPVTQAVAQPVVPAAPAAPVSELKAKYCSECGIALTPIGATGKSFCSKCNKIYD